MAKQDPAKIGSLRGGRRVWAVGAVHGEAARLTALHGALETRFQDGDRLVYLGNCLGRGGEIIQTVDELLLFRRALMARFCLDEDDIVFLRGSQEEMWHKMLQLQLAPAPSQILEWILAQGVDATLLAYGISPDTARVRCREGALALARWSVDLRQAIRAHPGHEQLLTALKRAAVTDDGAMLFVHAGLDPGQPLSSQGDSFWWGGADFSAIDAPYEGFRRIVRGYDARHGGVEINAVTATVDSGCGYGGGLSAACFAAGGEMIEIIEA